MTHTQWCKLPGVRERQVERGERLVQARGEQAGKTEARTSRKVERK